MQFNLTSDLIFFWLKQSNQCCKSYQCNKWIDIKNRRKIWNRKISFTWKYIVQIVCFHRWQTRYLSVKLNTLHKSDKDVSLQSLFDHKYSTQTIKASEAFSGKLKATLICQIKGEAYFESNPFENRLETWPYQVNSQKK